MPAHRAPARLLAALLPLTLGACASLLHSDYQRPALDMPQAWSKATTAQANTTPSTWWKRYQDSQLDALIAEVLAHNNDLASAAIKLRRAQLEAGLSADALRPTLGASVNHSSTWPLDSNGHSTHSNTAALTASYEADLWGRLASTRDAADWEARATEQDRASTALSLTGTTARLYWQLGYLDERIALSAQSIAYAEKTLALVRAKATAGAVSTLDVLQSEQDLASQQASHSALLQQRVEARTSLALLLDGAPSQTVADRWTYAFPNTLPPIEAGLPAALLAQRPDLRAAELRLRESLATVDATRASYYPTLSLTGSVGTGSTALKDLLRDPVGSLVAKLTFPFLQHNEMQLKIKVSQADYELAVISFRQTFYTALGDVENALSANEQYATQGALLEKSLAAAREVEQRYEIRYKAGATTLQSWLDAQEKRRTAEVSLAENRYNRLDAQVGLYLALGGDTQLSK